jgi:hypothetical protein
MQSFSLPNHVIFIIELIKQLIKTFIFIFIANYVATSKRIKKNNREKNKKKTNELTQVHVAFNLIFFNYTWLLSKKQLPSS